MFLDLHFAITGEIQIMTDNTSSGDDSSQTTRKRKRIVRRSDLPAAKLSKSKPTPKKTSSGKRARSKAKAAPKQPTIAPSAIRMDNLNASLNAFEVWRTFQPLALGIEKQIFQHINKHSLSCSKRVVQRLLSQHTKDTRYIKNLRNGVQRSNLDGSEVIVL